MGVLCAGIGDAMNFAQWALSIGQKPKPLVRSGLACPAIHLGERFDEVWDAEAGGVVDVPARPLRGVPLNADQG